MSGGGVLPRLAGANGFAVGGRCFVVRCGAGAGAGQDLAGLIGLGGSMARWRRSFSMVSRGGLVCMGK